MGTWSEACNTAPCPVNCKLSDWGEWAKCSVTCGGGTQHKTRTEAITAANGGTACKEDKQMSQDCNTQPCPQQCSWQEWGSWSECSVTCGKGEQKRARSKLEEHNGGRPCAGHAVETAACRPQAQCPESHTPTVVSVGSSAVTATAAPTTTATTPVPVAAKAAAKEIKEVAKEASDSAKDAREAKEAAAEAKAAAKEAKEAKAAKEAAKEAKAAAEEAKEAGKGAAKEAK